MSERAASAMMLGLELDGQAFAVSVACVRDVMRTPRLTPIPRAPAGVVGGLNLRGRVVVAVDPRVPLGLTADGERTRDASDVLPAMAIVVAYGADAYAVLADNVTDVADLRPELFAPMPPTLPQCWAEIANGVFRLPERLVVVLSLSRLLASMINPATVA